MLKSNNFLNEYTYLIFFNNSNLKTVTRRKKYFLKNEATRKKIGNKKLKKVNYFKIKILIHKLIILGLNI